MKEDNLFLLLRLGLGLEEPSEEALGLTANMSGKEWLSLRKTANKQSVLTIALDGLISLHSKYGQRVVRSTINRAKWEDFLYDWMANMLMMEQVNKEQLEVMNDMAQRWLDAGCRVLVMKGQANGLFYPHPNHRSKGDIDCYLFGDYSKGNDIAREAGAIVDDSWYKHSVIKYRGESFENHQYFVHTREGRSSKDLEHIMVETLENVVFDTLPNTSVLLPPPMFNALFLTYHALSHFLEEGLKLKQLVDWAMFLKRDAAKVDWPLFYTLCEKYHLRRFADVCTDIAVHYLGVKLDDPQIVTSSPYTSRVLDSTFNDNDYVFSSGEGGWKNRWHIVRNLWKYRWKYHIIYQHTVLRQLWFYATGYFFKTE